MEGFFKMARDIILQISRILKASSQAWDLYIAERFYI